MLRINPAQLSLSLIRRAAAVVRGGGLIAMPTDTVYGLAVDPFQPEAVRRLFRVKQRSPDKPVLLVVQSRLQVESLAARIPECFDRVVDRFWPGPLTLVLPAAKSVPAAITAGTGTVAVRLPRSVVTRELVGAARVPLTATSANISGHPAAESAAEVRREFLNELDLIVDAGPSSSRVPSTILDLTREARILREGAIPSEAVLRLC